MVKNSKTQIYIIGSGIVGQATGKGFIEKGFEVTFFDIKKETVESLINDGYKAHRFNEDIKPDFDLAMLTVPTPTEDGKINLSYLRKASLVLGKAMRSSKKYQVIVVRSTVTPGTTRKLVIRYLEKASGKKAGLDFGICMNPEYLRAITAEEDFAKPWFVVIGEYDKKSGDLLEEVYKNFGSPIERTSLEEAEIQKYIHNLYNAAKITFFNEMREICRKLKINSEKIFPLVAKSCEGMWNPRYGIRDLGPFDGACLPKDTQAFLTHIQEKGYEMPLLAAVIGVNNSLKEKLRVEQNKQEEEQKIEYVL